MRKWHLNYFGSCPKLCEGIAKYPRSMAKGITFGKDNWDFLFFFLSLPYLNVERGGASNTHVSVYLVFLCLQFVFLYLNFGREVQHLSVKSTSLSLTRSLQIYTVQLYLCIHVFIILCLYFCISICVFLFL